MEPPSRLSSISLPFSDGSVDSVGGDDASSHPCQWLSWISNPQHATPIRPLLVLLATLAGAVVIEGQRAGQATGPLNQRESPVVFQNVAPAAGLDFQHVNGASPEKHMVETMGSGGLFFDYDNDGWLDVFLVDGGSVVDRQV